MAWMLIGEPRQQSASAQNWVATPCTVTSSQVHTNRSSRSWTTSISIHYSYVWKGETLSGNRYSFAPTSNYSVEEMQKIVDSLPPGTNTTCYVNPTVPLESVLNRDTPSALRAGGLPFVMLIVFFAMAFGAWRLKARST
jgi:hypothetical protein